MPSELIKPAAKSTEAPKNMVRTDAREQKLDKFLSKSNHEPVPSPFENRTAKNSATDDSAVFELIDSTNSLELALQNRLNEKSSKEEKREENEKQAVAAAKEIKDSDQAKLAIELVKICSDDAMDDFVYTTMALPAHTDFTYLTTNLGLQVRYCEDNRHLPLSCQITYEVLRR